MSCAHPRRTRIPYAADTREEEDMADDAGLASRTADPEPEEVIMKQKELEEAPAGQAQVDCTDGFPDEATQALRCGLIQRRLPH